MRIDGVIYYVTGGGSGLGKATVYELIKRGAYVAILDMNVEAGEAIARDIGGRATFLRCDVRSEEDVNSAITAVDTLWGLERTVGGVVHCGGVGMAGLTVNSKGEPFSLDVFREVVDINLTGSFNIASKIAAKIVRSNPRGPSASNPTAPEITEDRGVIILVSSVSYEEGQQGQTAYGSSKAGVVGLLLPMARDLSRFGIRVCGVAPSLFSTAMGKNTSDKVRESLLESTLFPHRFGESSEFAQLAVSIIENSMLNGSVIRLDGGSRMSKF